MSDDITKTLSRSIRGGILLAGLTTAFLHAEPNSTLMGRVIDPSYRIVPGAEIVVRNLATFVQQTVSSNAEGIYEILASPVGVYRMQVRAPGFRPYIVEALTMDVAQILAQDIRLELGDISQEIIVKSRTTLMRDYLQRKYDGCAINVVITSASPPLERRPLSANPCCLCERAGRCTGVDVGAGGYGNPLSSQQCHDVRSGNEATSGHKGGLCCERNAGSIAQEELQSFQSRVAIHYLTDVGLEELAARIKDLPKNSVIIHVWQQLRNRQGNVLKSPDVLSRIARQANVPIYGMSATNVGLGIVGGYLYSQGANVAKLAELALRIANGMQPQDISIEKAPETPMFDWRQLVEGHRARRARHELQENEEHLEQLVEQRTAEAVEARDQAMEAYRAKSRFLANMSHELRTPLNAILGFSVMVRADTSLSDQHRKDLAIVGSSGEHLLKLIDDVLDMAKIHTGGAAVVQVVEDGRRAVETFQTWRPHFIWMDIRLPVMSGLEAGRRIREIEGSAREVKIAAATASAFDSQRDEVLASGFNDFLRKPYRPREIFDCMARKLGVKYVYGSGHMAPTGDLPATLKPEDLANLPRAQRDEVEDAVVSLDAKRIATVVRQVSGQNTLLGSTERLTGASADSPILNAIRSCKSKFTESDV